MPQLLKESDYWSPSSQQRVASNTNAVVAVAQETLIGVTARMLQSIPEDNYATKSKMLGRAMELEQEIEAFVASYNAHHLTELEAELVNVCEAGRIAQADVVEAKNNELITRNNENARINAYNMASRNLKTAQEAALPAFYDDADLKRKYESVSIAQAEYDAVQAEMERSPLAIPQAVQNVQNAERKLTTLQAREKAIRADMAALKGQSVEQPGSTGNRSAVGL